MKIVDPDQLNQGTEVVITPGTKMIQLCVAGNLNDASPGQTSGAALQAVYSFLKEEWKDDAALNKFRFPIKAIYEAKFLMQNGWNWTDAQTRQLIRDAGWKEVAGSEYATVISLGTMDDDQADQAYYQHVAGFSETTIGFDKTGRLNEPILIYDGSNNYRSYLKVFLREQGKTFDQYNLLVSQGLASLTYIAYRLPLSNQNDINIDYTDNEIETTQPFTSMQLQYYKGSRFEAWAIGQAYIIDDVVMNASNRWFRCLSAHIGAADKEPPNVTYWEVYTGEKLIGSSYFAFNREIRCNVSNKADAKELYAFAQYCLRQASNVNDDPDVEGYGTVNGNVANPLCYFVGAVLHGSAGVWFAEFDPAITNSIVLWSIDAATAGSGGLDSEDLPKTSTSRTFPYVATGEMVYNEDLVNDVDAEYWMYFSNAGGNQYDSANAIIVQNKDGQDIKGSVTQANIAFTFDYTNNAQGGRTPDTDAAVVVVAMGLAGAEWVLGQFMITKATGLTFPVNAATERNYST